MGVARATAAAFALLILDHACAFLSAPGLSVRRHGGVMRDGAIMMRATDRDLLVVGAGVLGGLLIEQHKKKYPEATIIAETRTTSKHGDLRSKGAECRTIDDAPLAPQPNVVFCAAPGANADYAGEVKKALSKWSGHGKFVFTSSGGVYAQEDGQKVDEKSATSTSARAQKLLDCERAVLDEGGSVVRLAGLYSLERGAHNYWLGQGAVDGRGDGLVGLLSYEDAAGSVLSVLASDKSKVAGEIFLICDGVEQTRQEICASALKTGYYKDKLMPQFKTSDGPIGKRYDISKARSVLGWQARYGSFDAFCLLYKDTPK